MATEIPNSPSRNSRSFQTVVAAFLSDKGLPFAEIFSAERIERMFAQHGLESGPVPPTEIAIIRSGAADHAGRGDTSWFVRQPLAQRYCMPSCHAQKVLPARASSCLPRGCSGRADHASEPGRFLLLSMLKQIATYEVANRPGRLEPRVVKRRLKPYQWMQKPRNELRRELRKRCN